MAVIEPDILMRSAISDFLRECGYTVYEGSTANEALAFLDAGMPIGTVFTEVALTGETDGFVLAQAVRARYPGVDVIITSGTASAVKKANDLCKVGPLEKPYDPQEVVRRIGILREQRRNRSSD